MKEGRHKIKYLKAFYVRGAFGVVELEIRLTDKSKVTVSNKKVDFKEEAIAAAEYVISNYYLPKNIEVIVHDTVISPCDTYPLHIAAAVIIGIFDICENPLSEEDRRKLDRFVLLNDKKKELDFSNLELSKSKIEIERYLPKP